MAGQLGKRLTANGIVQMVVLGLGSRVLPSWALISFLVLYGAFADENIIRQAQGL